MKVVLISALIIVVALFAFTIYFTSSKFTHLEGQIYISESPNDIELIKNAPVFLMKGRIFEKIEELDRKYKENFSDLNQRFLSLKEIISKNKKKFREDEVKLKTLRKMYEDNSAFHKSEFEKLTADVRRAKELTNRYEGLKDSVNVINSEFNREMENLIDNYLYLKTTTDERGAFKFKKVETFKILLFKKTEIQKYMIYSMVGKLFDKHVWMLQADVNKNTRINLTPENEFTYFK
ncbi:hypothetical protein ACFL4T_08470 [candidate division KSB1 bacterium]